MLFLCPKGLKGERSVENFLCLLFHKHSNRIQLLLNGTELQKVVRYRVTSEKGVYTLHLDIDIDRIGVETLDV